MTKSCIVTLYNMNKTKGDISTICSYLVSPGKGNPKVSAVQGTNIPLSGSLYDMLNAVFKGSEKECKIPISFNANNGKQKNIVRDELISFLKNPSEKTGEVLAKRLQDMTTGRSGLGLLFFSLGLNANGENKIVISRFPADQGILAERSSAGLTVSFVEKIFMKSAHAYKSVIYIGTSHDAHFWDGAAVDRQINSSGGLADYWIRDFLQSDFKITSKEGTKRLALALKATSLKISDESMKTEIIAATQLAKNLSGKGISVKDFATKFELSEPVCKMLVNNLPHPEMAEMTFQFDQEEFSNHVGFISKELDSGAILTGPANKFDELFITKKINGSDKELEFITKGKIITQRLKNKKF